MDRCNVIQNLRITTIPSLFVDPPVEEIPIHIKQPDDFISESILIDHRIHLNQSIRLHN